MKISDILITEQNQVDEGFKSALGTAALASMLALSPANAQSANMSNIHSGNFNNTSYSSTVHQSKKPVSLKQKITKPFFKIGSPYVRHGKLYKPHYNPEYNKVGIASWYGPGFHKKVTANGDVFDTNTLTAAHPTLPLPSKVWVTNLENGKKLLLTVTDRGPYAKNRIIDLSHKAAQLLGIDKKGTGKVQVEYDPAETEKHLRAVGLYDQFKNIIGKRNEIKK